MNCGRTRPSRRWWRPPAPDLRHSTGDVSVSVDGPVTRIDFGRAGAIFFAASGLRSRRIADYSEVEREIRRLLENGTWSADWDVVTEVLEADRVLLLVAKGAGASVELRGVDLSRLGAADESESTEASLRTPWSTVARQPASVKPRDARTGERNETTSVMILRRFDPVRAGRTAKTGR